MLNKKEMITIAIVTIVLALTLNIMQLTIKAFFYSILTVFLVLIINITAKKIASFYLDSQIEMKLWEIKRYGFKPGKYFKKPFPAGIFFPIIISALSVGYIIWMACLVFDVKPKIYRAAKRHGFYSFTEMTESHIGLIATAGVVANIAFATIGYSLGYMEFVKLNIYLSIYSIIPISNLDGNKIFFGNIVLWSLLTTIVLVALIAGVWVI